MLQSFIMVLREGFESFLIVAVIVSYLRTTGQKWLLTFVYSAVGVSLATSLGVGLLLMKGINQALWEGVLGLATMVMVGSLVVHMWKVGPRLSQNIQEQVRLRTHRRSEWGAACGLFVFTLLMITREGMEAALMLLQVREKGILGGIGLGLLATFAVAWLWTRLSQKINLKRFFQVTGVFLLLFLVQVGFSSFHEFSEAGLLPYSEEIHIATEPYSPYGIYGQWFSPVMVGVMVLWLMGGWFKDQSSSVPPRH